MLLKCMSLLKTMGIVIYRCIIPSQTPRRNIQTHLFLLLASLPVMLSVFFVLPCLSHVSLEFTLGKNTFSYSFLQFIFAVFQTCYLYNHREHWPETRFEEAALGRKAMKAGGGRGTLCEILPWVAHAQTFRTAPVPQSNHFHRSVAEFTKKKKKKLCFPPICHI